jgi:alpha-L-fucosidase
MTLVLVLAAAAGWASAAQGETTNVIPKPTPEQAAWQDLELTAFAHFGMNTFTDREWGEGTEDPALFNPTAFDARQWVRALKAAGFKLLILTAKHHDGFCLWPSRYTEHSVKNSPWRGPSGHPALQDRREGGPQGRLKGGGKGDVVREVADACREGGIKFGFYLSPWDRHEQTYGTPAYNEHFLHQLRELMSQYGPITEVWFDGANGDGPNGKRQEYDWARYYALVRELQPKALIAICGPDIRWVGNESGVAREDESSVQPDPNGGLRWYPAECDVSIRPGWFYHAAEDAKVKTLDHLMEIYYQSVGRNSNLLLNVPPDRRGLIHENDVKRLAELGAEIKRRFGKSVAETKGRGSTLELALGKPAQIDHVVLMEDIREGEQVRGWVVEGLVDGGWKELCKGAVIGHKRIVRFEAAVVSKVRVRCLDAAGEPIVRKFAVCDTGAK